MSRWYGSVQNRILENSKSIEPEVGMGVTECMWSDREPYEVIEVTDPRHIKVRRMATKVVSGSAFDGSAEYEYFSDPNGNVASLFKKKNGEIGGVFSNEYRGRKSDLGNLNEFPYMLHMGDNKEPSPGKEETEQINVASLNEIDEAYVCIVNYDAAVDEEDITYAEEGGRVELQSDSGDYLEVIADSTDHGPIYCVCSIKNHDGINSLKKSGKDIPEVMDLSTAWRKIPGFKLITEQDD